MRTRASAVAGALAILLWQSTPVRAQPRREPGHSIGSIAIRDGLIVMTLDEGALGKANLFDLSRRTLRFLPGADGYRVENVPLRWDSGFVPELTDATAKLEHVSFPFSGKKWDTLSIGLNGSIAFGPPTGGGRSGGVTIGRFDQLQKAARNLVNTTPSLCVFLKPRMLGHRFFKELEDRAVVTWDVTEPHGGIQDFTWVPTVNRFQAVLRADGVIEMSYQELTAKDAIVGVYPATPAGDIRSPEVHFSALKRDDGPFPVVYESFHYLSLPNPRDLTCTVIQALGDRFDMLAYYSDFRVDNQEAGTPSTGPLGGNVTGIGQTQRAVESYCSQGRFHWQFVQPVYAGSNQMQERAPEGVTSTNTRDVMSYERQLGERSPDGKMPAYNYAMSQIGHEMGHRWSAFVSAKVNGEVIPLGPTHWTRGLHAPVAFPYQRPTEASAMGGGVWQDNFDGTYTQLDDDYYVPATGWSYLDLYLMGMISAAEVPDFFLLRNLVAVGWDANGHPIFKADRVKITIQDVMAMEGPRSPAVDRAQKNFNTGIVVVVEHGQKPSRELLDRAGGIRMTWMDYWSTTTGHRSVMTTNAR
jgi:hypothetical protein